MTVGWATYLMVPATSTGYSEPAPSSEVEHHVLRIYIPVADFEVVLYPHALRLDRT